LLNNQLQAKSQLRCWSVRISNAARRCGLMKARRFNGDGDRRRWQSKVATLCGKLTALEARAVGVESLIYARTRIVNNNPGNPSSHAIVWRRSCARSGIVLSLSRRAENGGRDARHFPGHGDRGQDSQIDLPVIVPTALA